MWDLILCGIAYVILTYLLVTLLKKRKNDNGSNDDDGGLHIDRHPKIDLPPGITWPKDTDREIKYRPNNELESVL